jgi:beta-glucosidase/6-phospho-beta-glucosidase/beta-galactosidase
MVPATPKYKNKVNEVFTVSEPNIKKSDIYLLGTHPINNHNINKIGVKTCPKIIEQIIT